MRAARVARVAATMRAARHVPSNLSRLRLLPRHGMLGQISTTYARERFARLMSSSGGLSSEERVSGMQAQLEEYGADFVNIKDTSGGCGAFFQIHVVSSKFEGMNPVKRQRKVHELLHDFIHDVHGISLRSQHNTTHAKQYNIQLAHN